MRSLKHQILLLMLGSLVILGVCFILVFGWQMRQRALDAAIVKAKSDLATSMEIIDLTEPGPWREQDGILFKGDIQISYRSDLVDRLAELTGDTVTLFLGDTRVATTVLSADGKRAIGTKVSDAVAQTVLKNGQVFLGEANVVGQLYQTAYEPIRDSKGDIIGIFYVGISKSYTQSFIVNSIIRLGLLGLGLTLIVVLLTWFFIQKVIIRPLHEITLGTRDVATGHATEKIQVTGPKEIGDLALAFNQMVERLENVADEMSKMAVPKSHKEVLVVSTDDPELAPDSISDEVSAVLINDLFAQRCMGQHILPKGLNQATLQQIVMFLNEIKEPVSAEKVAEGVKLTRVTVRRYLDYLELCGVLLTELKYGSVGRPVKLFQPVRDLYLE